MNPAIKHTIKVIFVVIVIAGLIASYVFMGVSQQPAQPTVEQTQQSFDFTGPNGEPTVTSPSGAPTTNGPATPPPGN